MHTPHAHPAQMSRVQLADHITAQHPEHIYPTGERLRRWMWEELASTHNELHTEPAPSDAEGFFVDPAAIESAFIAGPPLQCAKCSTKVVRHAGRWWDRDHFMYCAISNGQNKQPHTVTESDYPYLCDNCSVPVRGQGSNYEDEDGRLTCATDRWEPHAVDHVHAARHGDRT